jgi:integrase
MIQVSYKLKKGRSALVAIVGRGKTRFELGTGVIIPFGVVFTPPKSMSGGDPKQRNKADADLNIWESGLRGKWDRLVSINPLATESDLKNMVARGKQKEAGFDATLIGWANKLTSRIDNGEMINKDTGRKLADNTLTSLKQFINNIEGFVAKYGDFDFGRYNSANATILGKAPVINKYKTLGAEFKNYILNDLKYGDQTTGVVMGKLRGLIETFSSEYGLTVDKELIEPLKYRARRKNSDEDIVALDDDQFEYIINNEEKFRIESRRVKQQRAIDYMIVGLLTCARKGDMGKWDSTNLRQADGGYRLRYIPEKTSRSSQAVVDVFPLSDRVVSIFKKNLELYNKLLPPLPFQLGRAIQAILKKHEIFDRQIVIRTSDGGFVTKKTSEAFKAHSLRSSGITYLLSQGMQEMMVKKISGHSQNSQSFLVYAKVLEKNKQQAYRDVFAKFATPQLHTEQ